MSLQNIPRKDWVNINDSVSALAALRASAKEKLSQVFLDIEGNIHTRNNVSNKPSASLFHNPSEIHALTENKWIHSRFDSLTRGEKLYAQPETKESFIMKRKEVMTKDGKSTMEVLSVPRILNLGQIVIVDKLERDKLTNGIVQKHTTSFPIPYQIDSYRIQRGSVVLNLSRTSTTEDTKRYLEVVIPEDEADWRYSLNRGVVVSGRAGSDMNSIVTHQVLGRSNETLFIKPWVTPTHSQHIRASVWSKVLDFLSWNRKASPIKNDYKKSFQWSSTASSAENSTHASMFDRA